MTSALLSVRSDLGLSATCRKAAAGAAAAGEADDGGDGRVAVDDADDLRELAADRLETDRLVGAQSALQRSGILLRKKALGDGDIEPDGETDRHREYDHHQRDMAERPVERPGVAALDALEAAAEPVAARVFLGVVGAQQQRRQHRRHGQRQQQADHHRRRQGDRELAEQTPDDAAHEQQGDEHRDQADRDRDDGEADLLRADQRRLERLHAALDVAADVLQHDDGVVDDEPGGDGQRHQRQVVEAEPAQEHHRQRAGQRHHDRDRRHHRRAPAAEEDADHGDDQQCRDQQSDLDLVQRGADGDGAVGRDLQVDVGGQRGAQHRQLRLYRVDGGDDVRAGLAADDGDHGRLAVEQAGGARVLDRVRDAGDLVEADGGTVAIGDRQAAIVGGGDALVVGVDLETLAAALDRALGPVGVRRLDRGADILQCDAHRGELDRVDLDPHGRERAAAELDIADAFDLQQLLLQDGGDRIVDLAGRACLRGQRQDHDRRVGRVDLAVGRVGAQRRGQVGAAGVDRRLHVARRAIDVAAEIELQRDAAAAQPRVGRHLGDVGDGAEAAFERRCDTRPHRRRRRAGQAGADRYGREIDLRQRRHRQHEERRDARDQHADGQQQGADRPLHEGRGDVHPGSPRAGSAMFMRPLPVIPAQAGTHEH